MDLFMEYSDRMEVPVKEKVKSTSDILITNKWEPYTRDLLACSLCGDICKRAVVTRCCQATACRACAVKKITSVHACWGERCQGGVSAEDLDNDDVMREAVDQFKAKGKVEQEHVKQLRERLREEVEKERNVQGKGVREEVMKLNETKSLEERIRGRAKSVPRERSKNVERRMERAKSVAREDRRSWSPSSDSEREEEETFFNKMNDMERDQLVREKMKRRESVYDGRTRSIQPLQGLHRKDASKSRSRSPIRNANRDTKVEEKMVYHLGYWVKESKLMKEKKNESRPSREDKGTKAPDDNKKEKPCKFFNETGHCRYINGHPDQFGNANLHICATCYDDDVKINHARISCNRTYQVVRSHKRKEEPCIFFNKFGNCSFESGHLSQDGNYTRLHICKLCFINNEKKKFHPAITCKIRDTRRDRSISPRRDKSTSPRRDRSFSPRRDRYISPKRDGSTSPKSDRFTSPKRNRSTSPSRDRSSFPTKDRSTSPRRDRSKSPRRDRSPSPRSNRDEKPCTYFNNTGFCRRSSGHLSRLGNTAQLHICSCCMEFRRQVSKHSAVHCKLKKRLTGDWGDNRDRNELPCHTYNAGRCFLQSGHPIKNQGHTSSGPRGLVKMLHICKFCFEYRGENNAHNDRECKLKKKIMHEVENERHDEKSIEHVHGKKKARAGEPGKNKRNEERREFENERHYEKSIKHVHGKKKEGADEPLKSKRNHEKREVENESFIGKSDQHKKGVCETNINKKKEREDIIPNKKGERDPEKTEDIKEMRLDGNQRKSVDEKNTETEFFNSKLFMQVKEANDTAVTKKPFRVCLIKNNNGNNVENSIKKQTNINKLEITKNENQKKHLNMEGIVSLDMNPVEQSIGETGLNTNAGKMAFNNKCSTPIKKEDQENGAEQMINLPSLNAKVSHVKKRRKLERFNPHAIIHLNDAKTPNPHPSIILIENENIDLKPVLLDNVQGEEIDPNTEIEEDKIMKKIEILEKLHAIEIEKLRKAQEQMQVPNNSLD